MSELPSPDVTQLLLDWQSGEKEARLLECQDRRAALDAAQR